jgi:hypothetical protein
MVLLGLLKLNYKELAQNIFPNHKFDTEAGMGGRLRP